MSMGTWLQRLDGCGWLRTVHWALEAARTVAAKVAEVCGCVSVCACMRAVCDVGKGRMWLP